jgi:hypothetical protein
LNPPCGGGLQLGRTLARSNENVKNIGEERRTRGGRRRADEPSGLAGPRAQATDREDAWQEDPSTLPSPPTEKTARTEGSERRTRENATERAAERTNQPARQTTRPRRRQTERPTGHQPAQPDPRPDAAAVRLRPSLQPSSRRHPSPAVQTGGTLGSSPPRTAHQGRGRGQGHAPGGRDMWGHAWACSCPCPCPCLEPCARAFERGETGQLEAPPRRPSRPWIRPPTPWLSLVSRADIRNPVSSNPPFRSVRQPSC